MTDTTTPTPADATTSEHAPDGPTVIDAAPERGFNYPYCLAVPEQRRDTRRPLLVEPHNVGEQVETLDRHIELAEQRIQNESVRDIGEALGTPILIPIFPRPAEEPVDWTHMTHMLCAKTMQIADGPLERIDRQLLAMVDDARERLGEWGVPVPEEFILNGFSSQAAFVNRFAALHPDRVCSVSAGGINGLAILPQETATVRGFGDRPLNYPVGVANIEDLTGDPFDAEAFRDLHQFIYMGSEDDRDALLYPDAWTDPDLRATAVLTYGEDIHEERFPHCQQAYDDANVNAVFRTYDGVGHTPDPALDDIVEFHDRSLAGDDIDAIRGDIA